MDKLFIVIGRINNVLVLLILLGMGGAMVYYFAQRGTSRDAEPALVAETITGTKAEVRLGLGHPFPIHGTDATMIDLRSEHGYSKIGSGKGGGEIRNLLFLTGAGSSAHWLFKGNRNLIIESAQIQKGSRGNDSPTLAIYVKYIAADTNGDGVLSAEDDAAIGIAMPDGTGFGTAVQGANRVISYQMCGGDQLCLVYQRGATLRKATFSLARHKVDSDTEILKVTGGA